MWTQDHILFSLFRRCSGEMENFALSSFGFGRSVCLFCRRYSIVQFKHHQLLHYVPLRTLKKLMERIASMERGGADVTPLISRRFAFSFVLHTTRHSKCGGDCR